MFDITILGTSGSAPTKERGLSSVALEHDGEIYLFDCGEGTQRQMQLYGVNISKVSTVLITHTHADHMLGIAGLFRTMALYKRSKDLSIYFPDGFQEGIESLIKFDKAFMTFNIKLVPVKKSGTIMAGKDFEIRAFKLNHSIKCYGYVFKENDRMQFIKDKCRRLSIKGKAFKELQSKGKTTVNSRVITLSEVTTKKPGLKFAYAVDTRPTATTAIAAKGADILIHEATYGGDLAKLAKERKHSTSVEAAEIAKSAEAKKLIITHFSTRYKTSESLVSEARAVFKESYAAYDGMKLHVK